MSAEPTQTKSESGRGRVSERPGWAQLREAGAQLHAAEVLLGDPVAAPSTVFVHLRGFWTAAHAAGLAAGIGKAGSETPLAWLEAPISGLEKGTRAQLRGHLERFDELEAAMPWNCGQQLRRHARAARELFDALEPVIGGVPLRRRRLRLLWGTVGIVLLFGPLAGYYALNREVEGSGPWRATYFTDKALEKQLTVLREPELDKDWGKGPPLEAVPPDKFSVRWDTCLELDEAGSVVLQVRANDGVRVFLDGEAAIDAWDKDPKTRKRGSGSAKVELEAGIHHLSVEYFESMGSATIKLAASFGDEVPAPIPSEMLIYPGDRLDDEDPCGAARGGE